MIKIFETGDIHIGKKYDDYPTVKDKLQNTRFDVLNSMVKQAEQENCDFFVVTGDLFDNVRNIAKKDVQKIVGILADFPDRVLVLPGNHDFYDGECKVWKEFEQVVSNVDNITLLNEFRVYSFKVGEESVDVYPAYCQDKHSEKNNLEWIKNADVDPNKYNIGIAHGAIQGITPDKKQEYYLMSQNELELIPMDLWLIGHTHVPFPEVMRDEQEHKGYKIFNAGTHAQTDFRNNTPGYGFLISVDQNNGQKTVTAKAIKSGEIRFYDLDLAADTKNGISFERMLSEKVSECDKNSIIRVNISGTVKQDEYEERNDIYEKILSKYLLYKIEDHELSNEITIDTIKAEYAETSFAYLFLEKLMENPKEMAMAYEILKECKE